MKIEFLGHGVIVATDRASTWLSAQDLLELFTWLREHRLELSAKIYEMKREQQEQQQPTRLLIDEQAQYFLGDD